MESHVVQAWEEDPLDTLKLIAHLRDVRDGKADRNLFHDCIAWLWQHHPLTLLGNLDEIVKVSGTAAHCSKGSLDASCHGPVACFCILWVTLSNSAATLHGMPPGCDALN